MNFYEVILNKFLEYSEQNGNVADATIEFLFKDKKIWASTSQNWEKYWKEEREGLLLTVYFDLVDFPKERSKNVNQYYFQPFAEKSDHYQISGKIIEKKSSKIEGYEVLSIDTGVVIVTVGVEKESFKVGDFIKTTGILQVQRVKENGN